MKLVLQLLLFLVATSSLAECIRAQSLTEQLVDEDPAKLVELALKNGNIVRGAILFHQGNTGPLARQHVLQDFLEKVMGYSPEVTEYFDPIIAISMGGVGADVYSAYSAKLLELPGTQARYKYDATQDDDDVGAYSFPGGNTGIFRHIVKHLVPWTSLAYHLAVGSKDLGIFFQYVDQWLPVQPHNHLSPTNRL